MWHLTAPSLLPEPFNVGLRKIPTGIDLWNPTSRKARDVGHPAAGGPPLRFLQRWGEMNSGHAPSLPLRRFSPLIDLSAWDGWASAHSSTSREAKDVTAEHLLAASASRSKNPNRASAVVPTFAKNARVGHPPSLARPTTWCACATWRPQFRRCKPGPRCVW